MGWIDQVPRAGNLYIGGYYAIRRTDAVKAANISHVLSVLRPPLDEEIFSQFKHLHIEVDDDSEENLLQYFPQTNKFIEDGLRTGTGVFVHCAMGKSRSATCVIAHLMYKYGLSPTAALEQLREGRGVCDPNPGFAAQLELYYRMGTPDEVQSNPMYQRWQYEHILAASRACRLAPAIDSIRFEDEVDSAASSETTERPSDELKCKRCRRTVATSKYLIVHTPSPSPATSRTPQAAPNTCSHHFVDALSWMRPELEQGKLEGRLECPKCSANIGKYAWQGMQCSCGGWVVPGISLAKGRVDEVRAHAAGTTAPGAADIRMPPPAENKTSRGPNGGNL